MKILRNFLNKQKPRFQKGGRFQRFRATFDAFETFLFVPNRTSQSGTHIRDGIDLKRTMIVVVISLLPALLFGMWNVGFQHFTANAEIHNKQFIELFFYGFKKVLPIIIVSYVVGLGIEFIFAE